MSDRDFDTTMAHVPAKPGDELTLILMAGLPGTGKTTLALAIGRIFGWPVIDKDSLKSPLLTTGISNELAGPASYALLLEMARDLLVQQRLSIILDSPAGYRTVLEHVVSLTHQAGAHLKIILCVANQEVRAQRIRGRLARPSQWTTNGDISDEQARQMFAHLPATILTLDTTCPFEQCIAEALAYSSSSSSSSHSSSSSNSPL
jgi:predicted kinase